MLRKLEIEVGPTATPVLKAAALREARQGASLLEQARIQACKLLDEANQQARRARSQGFDQGLLAGIEAAAAPFLAAVADFDRIGRELRDEAWQRVRESLASLCMQPEIVERVLQRVLHSAPLEAPGEVRIELPSEVVGLGVRLEELASETGCRLHVVAGESGHMRVSWGAHRWETCLDAWIETARATVSTAATDPGPPATLASRHAFAETVAREQSACATL